MDTDAFIKRQEERKKQAAAAAEKRAMERRAERGKYLSRIRGSLIGGAVGDALGYPVEFMPWKGITREYGPEGIQSYCINRMTGNAVITDDTQMTLFTANGILIGETHGRLKGIQGPIADYVHIAYREWQLTQEHGADVMNMDHRCWLFEIPTLHVPRAPGLTCLSALRSGKMGSTEKPLNNSKGCGGVMRVAPLGLHYRPETEDDRRFLDKDGAEIAAITHGHPLGWLPAAVMTHMIGVGVYGDGRKSIRAAADEAWETVRNIYGGGVSDYNLDAMEKLIVKAEKLSAAEGNDVDQIRSIGEGWTGDEALAIALYCCLRYPDDFTRAITAAVNHSGDSDSTGAVAGNILGAFIGEEAIGEKWKADLEMLPVIMEMADDLCYGCVMVEGEDYMDEDWVRKYCEGHAGKPS
ncbi:MAG: ADP-ribosylglycohydrolase family protein [Clostridia bacterium]|nr:ADP-ribosylglycohydrolase family protein [Clostridia bacterium]